MSSISSSLFNSPLTSRLREFTTRHFLTLNIGAASFVLGYLSRAAVTSYRGYLALGRGGLPHNLLGWLLQGVAQLVAHGDTRSVEPFSRPATREKLGEEGTESFLGLGHGRELGMRKGGRRPTVPGYVAPQRQVDQFPVEEEGATGGGMRGRMEFFLEELVTANPGVLVLKPSGLEGVGTPAVWLVTGSGTGTTTSTTSTNLPAFMKGGLKGETVHVHHECSSHVTLSAADAEDVVRRGWAERHPLSGVGIYLPWTYLMVYAPRDEDEFGVWKEIVKAGVRFVCAAAGRRDLVKV